MEERDYNRTREGIVTGAAIIICLGSFIGVMRLSFPDGMDLGGLIRAGRISPWEDVAGAPSLDPSGLSRRQDRLARLVSVTRKVKSKPPEAIAWGDAKAGLDLGNRHSVQTLEGASATIEFDPASSLILGENSLIVLQSYDGESDGSEREATLLVFGGELRAQITAGPGGDAAGGSAGAPFKLRVRTPSGETLIRAREGSVAATDVRVKVAEDSTATISVIEGVAEVTAEDGKMEVAPGEALDVRPGVPLAAVRELPGVPAPDAPVDGESVFFRSRAPAVEFRWEPAPHSDRTRLTVARDRLLEDVVLQETVTGASFVPEILPEGRYFWSVQGLGRELEGAPSPVRSLTLVLDDEGPPLEVEWPAGEVSAKTLRLSGSTEPGALVFVGAAPAATQESGAFEIELELVPGANSIVVESVDPVGNSSYETRIVKARY